MQLHDSDIMERLVIVSNPKYTPLVCALSTSFFTISLEMSQIHNALVHRERTPTGFIDLCAELALIIFEALRLDVMLYMERDPSVFWAFARLRTVCHTWNQLLTPLFYRKFFIKTLNPIYLVQVQKLLITHGRLVRHLIIDCPTAVDKQSWTYDRANMIRICVAQCKALDTLECKSAHHAFKRKNWLHFAAPDLTLKRLVFSPCLEMSQYGVDLSHALTSVGRTIESLEIRNWYKRRSEAGIKPTKFCLPSTMPRLTRITLRQANPPIELLYKIFSRIVSEKIVGSNRRHVPLRDLSLVGVDHRLVDAHLVNILEINQLGTYLTSLHFDTPFSSSSESEAFPVNILKVCPSLIDFFCYAPSNKQMFDYLPQSLQHLGVQITLGPTLVSSLSDFAGYVESLQAHTLETLNIRTYFDIKDEDDRAVGAMCTEKSILLNILRLPHYPSFGYRM